MAWIRKHRSIGTGVNYRIAKGFPPLSYQLSALWGMRKDCAYPYCNYFWRY